jgi:hypothetical protein
MTPPPRNSRNERVNTGRKNGPVLYMDSNGYIYLAIIKTNRLGVHPNRVEYANLNRPAPPYNPNAWKKHFKPASPKRSSPKRNGSPKRKRNNSPPVSNWTMPSFPGL